MKSVFIILVLVCFFSCKNNEYKLAETITSSKSDTSLLKNRAVLEKAINTNDTNSYNAIVNQHMLHVLQKDLLYYVLRMAYRNKYSRAYFHVFIIFTYLTPNGPKKELEQMDANSRNFALYHLLKSHEMGCSDAKYYINATFDNPKTIPSSQYYLSELNKEYLR